MEGTSRQRFSEKVNATNIKIQQSPSYGARQVRTGQSAIFRDSDLRNVYLPGFTTLRITVKQAMVIINRMVAGQSAMERTDMGANYALVLCNLAFLFLKDAEGRRVFEDVDQPEASSQGTTGDDGENSSNAKKAEAHPWKIRPGSTDLSNAILDAFMGESAGERSEAEKTAIKQTTEENDELKRTINFLNAASSGENKPAFNPPFDENLFDNSSNAKLMAKTEAYIGAYCFNYVRLVVKATSNLKDHVSNTFMKSFNNLYDGIIGSVAYKPEVFDEDMLASIGRVMGSKGKLAAALVLHATKVLNTNDINNRHEILRAFGMLTCREYGFPAVTWLRRVSEMFDISEGALLLDCYGLYTREAVERHVNTLFTYNSPMVSDEIAKEYVSERITSYYWQTCRIADDKFNIGLRRGACGNLILLLVSMADYINSDNMDYQPVLSNPNFSIPQVTGGVRLVEITARAMALVDDIKKETNTYEDQPELGRMSEERMKVYEQRAQAQLSRTSARKQGVLLDRRPEIRTTEVAKKNTASRDLGRVQADL